MSTEAPAPPWEIHVQPDIDWTIRIKVHEYAMDFEAFHISYREWWDGQGGHHAEIHYRHAEDDNERTTDLDQAARIFRGTVKWDGCSDWAWDTSEVMWHACSMQSITEIGDVMRRAYALAAEKLPTWDGSR